MSEKIYTCRIHADAQVSQGEYIQGFNRCVKCGNDLIPVEIEKSIACVICNRNFSIIHNQMEHFIRGQCPTCKWVYDIKKEG